MKSVEDRPKKICLNKRSRTSMAEFQAEYQINSLKKQPATMAKDVNFLKDSDEKSDQFEKSCRQAAVDEGLDYKIKRKRSMGTILSKPIDGGPKRSIQNRVVDEHDAHKSRSNDCDDSYTITSHSPLRKKKVLRTTQMGSRAHETHENWENAMAMETEMLISNERDNNRKPPFGQWVGQRPPKVPRTRRSNLVSEDDDDCSPSNGSGTHRNATNGSLKIVVKLDKLQCGVEESGGGGEKQVKGKMGNNEGRTARGLLISRCSMSPKGKKLDNAGTPQKNASKSGRRLKRLSEFKGLSNDAPLQNSSSPDSTGDSDYDDKEELQSAATHARIPTSCSSPLWKKKMEPKFSPITSDEKALLSPQMGLDAAAPVYEKRKTNTPRQQTESFFKKHDMDHHKPFYQRVLSALIIEDDSDIEGLLEADARNIQIQNSFSVSTSDPRKKARVYDSNCGTAFSSRGQSLGLTKKPLYEDVNSEYEKMCVDDRLLLELQCIGLCLDTLPGLEDKEDDYTPHEVDNNLHQQGSRRISRFGNPKAPKQVARCQKSGFNCFNEIPLKDILSAPIVNKQEHTASVDSQSNPNLLSEEASAVNQQTPNGGKNKKILLDNIGGPTTISGRTKGKRSNRAPTKPQPKRQKTDLPPTPKGKSVNKPTDQPQPQPQPPHPVNETTKGNDHTNPAPLVEDLETIDEIGAVGGPHDLESLLLSFNEEEEGDLEEDFAEGLAVPDDDLTCLGLF